MVVLDLLLYTPHMISAQIGVGPYHEELTYLLVQTHGLDLCLGVGQGRIMHQAVAGLRLRELGHQHEAGDE